MGKNVIRKTVSKMIGVFVAFVLMLSFVSVLTVNLARNSNRVYAEVLVDENTGARYSLENGVLTVAGEGNLWGTVLDYNSLDLESITEIIICDDITTISFKDRWGEKVEFPNVNKITLGRDIAVPSEDYSGSFGYYTSYFDDDPTEKYGVVIFAGTGLDDGATLDCYIVGGDYDGLIMRDSCDCVYFFGAYEDSDGDTRVYMGQYENRVNVVIHKDSFNNGSVFNDCAEWLVNPTGLGFWDHTGDRNTEEYWSIYDDYGKPVYSINRNNNLTGAADTSVNLSPSSQEDPSGDPSTPSTGVIVDVILPSLLLFSSFSVICFVLISKKRNNRI